MSLRNMFIRFLLSSLSLYLLSCFISMEMLNPFAEYVGSDHISGELYRLVWLLTSGSIALSSRYE